MTTLAMRRRALPLVQPETVRIVGPVRQLERAAERRVSEPPRFICEDNQDEMLPKLREVRARRALYAECERAPLGWEKRLG